MPCQYLSVVKYINLRYDTFEYIDKDGMGFFYLFFLHEKVKML